MGFIKKGENFTVFPINELFNNTVLIFFMEHEFINVIQLNDILSIDLEEWFLYKSL